MMNKGFFAGLLGGRARMAGGYETLTPQQARQMMADQKDYILLDVRTPAEYRQIRIKGAALMPDYEIHARAKAELPDPNALIFVYCQSGSRSKNAARRLAGMGYTQVRDMGGIIDWPFETTRG